MVNRINLLRAMPSGSCGSGPADGSHFPAVSASAEELIAAIRFQPRHAHSRRQIEYFKNFPVSRINLPEIALVTFPTAMPEFSIDPGHAGDEAVALDRTKYRPGLRIDLLDAVIHRRARPRPNDCTLPACSSELSARCTVR
jgi:hypothetical protein